MDSRDLVWGKRLSLLGVESQQEGAAVFFSRAMDDSPVAIVGLNAEARVSFWNKAAERLFGWTEAELLGRAYPLVLAEERAEFEARWPGLLAGRNVLRQEATRVSKSGKSVDVLLTTTSLKNRDGRIVGAIGYMEDVSALKDRERELRELFHNSADIVISMDEKGTILNVSPSIREILGYAPSELAGRDGFAFLHPEDLERTRALFREAAAKPLAIVEEEVRAAHKDGRWRILQTRGRFIPGSPGRMFFNSRDVTVQRTLEAELRQAQKMECIGRLSGGVAHDFNNLLTAIMGTAELAAAQLPEGHPARADIEEIRQTGERAARLTRQLLAFSRRKDYEPQVIDLAELVDGIVVLLRRVIGEDIKLVIERPADRVLVMLDPTHLEQLLLNLAVNARDAMPRGGTLTVRAASEGGRAVLLVRDTGCGMSAEVRAHLFEPFFTTKEEGKGTGLGLATCLDIVKQNKGTIDVASRLGQGTEFRLAFPAAASA
jgi:PAS domain S-box-containing protein